MPLPPHGEVPDHTVPARGHGIQLGEGGDGVVASLGEGDATRTGGGGGGGREGREGSGEE